MEAARKRDESSDKPVPPSDPKSFTKSPPIPRLSRAETQFMPPTVAAPLVEQLTRPEIAEFVILSSQGDVIYDWKCPDVNARVSFLEFISQKAGQLGQDLPLGPFESFEISGSKSRIITQLENDHAVFVKTNLLPVGVGVKAA